ncbi:hypothetical protein ACFRIB_01590 [Streptomyces mirabilis]|uniref:hypothetical protein n=1 Tax=Streptomyces mirabilis TaxID=68239 RepID=UPI0036BE70E4
MPASSAVCRSLAWCTGPPATSAKVRCARRTRNAILPRSPRQGVVSIRFRSAASISDASSREPSVKVVPTVAEALAQTRRM